MSNINHMTKEELLSFPEREWNKTSEYGSILILPRNEEHDSGWNMMYIIGLNEKQEPFEVVASSCDDIEWSTTFVDRAGKYILSQMRCDCCMESGAIRFWCRGAKLRVGDSLSTITIEIIKDAN